MNQEADIALGSITITESRQIAVDFTIPYYDTAAGFIANTDRELTRWASLMRPYQFEAWVAIICCVILVGPVLWVIAKQYHRKISLSTCFGTSYKIFLKQGNSEVLIH